MQAETQVQGDDQFEARPASGTEPTDPRFQRNRAKLGPVWRYHAYRDRRWLAVRRRTETDLFSGELVGYAMSKRMTKHLVMQALFRAVASQRPAPGLIHHTDRGSQYCAQAHRKLVDKFRVQASMSRRENCFYNAPIESFWGTPTGELVYHRRFATREEARRAISEYIEICYNRQRTQARLNYRSPVAFTQRYYLNRVAA